MLDLRFWPMLKTGSVVLLVISSAVVTNTVRFRQDRNHSLRALADQSRELQQAKNQLQETEHLLSTAERKLGFLMKHKTAVQVTAFTGNGSFANGVKTVGSYAVPSHILPEGKVLNIALSPTARQNLHAKLNDYIVLLDMKQQKSRLARFVDTTSANEIRPVVDIFFEKQEDALRFGRQHFLAVNISAGESPF